MVLHERGFSISAGMALLGLVLSMPVTAATGAEEDRTSPWLLTPLLSSNPKLGTSVGGMGAYVTKLDAKAPPSMFGGQAQYSTTDSYTYGVFGRAYLGADEHRIVAFLGGGEANNDYQDFLGSGIELESTDDFQAFYGSYLNRVSGDWFVGFQAAVNHYSMLGSNELTSMVLDVMDLGGFDSNALGLRVSYDSRDNTQSPSSGHYFNVSQLAYRESLGGDVSFDVYNGKWGHYISHGKGSVFATEVAGRFTHDAPASGFSTIRARGYVPGEYRAPYVISAEAEERYFLSDRWRLAVFGGVACLFDDAGECSDTSNLYASGGLGVHYVLRPKEKMIIRLDFARGEGGSQGLYFAFGQAI